MREDPTPEQIAKLPKWAQHRINLLEMRLREARDRIDLGNDGTTIVNPYSNDPMRFDAHSTVQFGLGDSPRGPLWIQVQVRGDELYVNGIDSIAVIPQVTNAIRIKLEER